MLDSARRNTVRVWAEGVPYDLKDELKKRGYRWNDGSDGRPRSWHIEIDEAHLQNEIDHLRREIYRRQVDPYVQTLCALMRFSARS